MLQFIAQKNDKYTLPEQVQMALEGGCKWIQLRLEDMRDSEIRELAPEIVPLCKETSAILVIEDNLDMAKELGIHGVHLRKSKISPSQAREILGPEAIIGVEVSMASEALSLVGLDMDYVTFPPSISDERLSEFVEALRDNKFELPIVKEGEFGVDGAKAAILNGANGVAIGRAIMQAEDPVAETEKIIQALME